MRHLMRKAVFIVVLTLIPAAALSQGFSKHYTVQTVEAGKKLYEEACTKCHGVDGKGVPKEQLDIKTDVPDFTRCADQGEETDYKWFKILSHGGSSAGLTEDMPSFELYSEEQRLQAIAYSRTFCKENWVRGELNFERLLTTEKAYPENELILSPVIAHSKETGTSIEWESILERRIGNRLQFEAVLPITARNFAGPKSIVRGVGDGEIGLKYVLAHSMNQRFILSGGLDLSSPTGRTKDDLGHGTWIIEPHLMLGKAFGNVIFQGQVKEEFPFDEKKAGRAFLYRAGVGYRLRPDPRGIFPSLEVVGEGGEVALIPQLRYGISKTGKWAIGAGVRKPVNGESSERFAVIGYLLWEYLGR